MLEDYTNNSTNKSVNKLTKKASNALDKSKEVLNKAKTTISATTIPFDFSLADLDYIFGGILTFPEFANEKPMKECEGELGYQKRHDELMEQSLKDANEMSNDHQDVGSFFTVSPKEQKIFLKKQIKVDCVPVEPTINPNSKGKEEPCWNTKECMGGLKCNNTEKYIQGICEEDSKIVLSSEGEFCYTSNNCKDDLECSGNYLTKFFGNGSCKSKKVVENKANVNSVNKTRKNKNNIADNSGFRAEN
jgi:hypothetical protein